MKKIEKRSVDFKRWVKNENTGELEYKTIKTYTEVKKDDGSWEFLSIQDFKE